MSGWAHEYAGVKEPESRGWAHDYAEATPEQTNAQEMYRGLKRESAGAVASVMGSLQSRLRNALPIPGAELVNDISQLAGFGPPIPVPMGANVLADSIERPKKYLKGVAEANAPSPSTMDEGGGILGEGDELKWWLGRGAGVVGSMAPMIAGAVLGGPVGGVAGAWGTEAGSATEEAEKRMLDKGYDENRAKVLAKWEGGLVGTVAAALSVVPVGKFLGKTKIATKAAKESAAQAGRTQMAKGIVSKAVEAVEKMPGGHIALASGGEAVEEMLTEATSMMAQRVFESDPEAFKGAADQLLTSLALGGVGGGVVGTPGSIIAKSRVDSQKVAYRQAAAQEFAKNEPQKAAELAKMDSISRKQAQDYVPQFVKDNPRAFSSQKDRSDFVDKVRAALAHGDATKRAGDLAQRMQEESVEEAPQAEAEQIAPSPEQAAPTQPVAAQSGPGPIQSAGRVESGPVDVAQAPAPAARPVAAEPEASSSPTDPVAGRVATTPEARPSPPVVPGIVPTDTQRLGRMIDNWLESKPKPPSGTQVAQEIKPTQEAGTIANKAMKEHKPQDLQDNVDALRRLYESKHLEKADLLSSPIGKQNPRLVSEAFDNGTLPALLAEVSEAIKNPIPEPPSRPRAKYEFSFPKASDLVQATTAGEPAGVAEDLDVLSEPAPAVDQPKSLDKLTNWAQQVVAGRGEVGALGTKIAQEFLDNPTQKNRKLFKEVAHVNALDVFLADKAPETSKPKGLPKAKPTSGRAVADAIDQYEPNGGSMHIDDFVKDNDLGEYDILEVVDGLTERSDAVDFDPETGEVTFRESGGNLISEIRQPRKKETPPTGANTLPQSKRVQAGEPVADQPVTKTDQEGASTDSAQEVADKISKIFNKFVVKVPERMQRKALGYYKFLTKEVAVKETSTANIGVRLHEIAHALDERLGITGHLRRIKQDPPSLGGDQRQILTDAELNEISHLDYDNSNRPDEGWAEFFRIYVMYGEDVAAKYAPAATNLMGKIIAASPDMKQMIADAQAAVKGYSQQGFDTQVDHLFARKQKVFEGRSYDDEIAFRKTWLGFAKRLFDRDIFLERFTKRTREEFLKSYAEYNPSASKAEAEVAWTSHKRRVLGTNPYLLKMMYSGTPLSMAAHAFDNGLFDINTKEKLSGSMKEIFGDINIKTELEDFEGYIASKVGIKNYDRSGGRYIPGEVSIEAMRAKVSDVENDPKRADRYQNTARKVTEWYDALLEIERRHGLLDYADIDRIKRARKVDPDDDSEDGFYIPFDRVIKRGFLENIGFKPGTIMGVKTTAKRLKGGSNLPIMDLATAMLNKAEATYSAATRKDVEAAVVKWALSFGMGEIMGEVPPKTTVERKRLDSYVDQLVKADVIEGDLGKKITGVARLKEGGMGREALENLGDMFGIDGGAMDYNKLAHKILTKAEREGVPDGLTLIATYGQDYSSVPGDRIVRVRDPGTGEFKMYQFHDKELYDTLVMNPGTSTDPWINLFLRSSSMINNISKYLMVRWNPAFVLRNIARDMQLAQMKGLEYGSDPGLKSLTMPFTGLADATTAFVGMKDDISTLYEDLGGKWNTYFSGSEGKRRKRIKSKLGTGTTAGKVSETARKGLELYEDAIAIAEQAPRMWAFRETIMRNQGEGGYKVEDGKVVGKIPQWVAAEAMNNSLEITTNFRRRGTWAPALDSVIMFFNAAMQGSYGMVRTTNRAIRDKGAATRFAANLTLRLLHGAAVPAAMYFAGKDDKDEDEKGGWLSEAWRRYQMLDDDVRRKYMMFMAPGTNRSLAVARDREWGFMDQIGEQIAMSILRKNPETFDDFIEELSEITLGRLGDAAPTGGAIPNMLQAAVNYNWFKKRPIEKDYYHSKKTGKSERREDLNPIERYSDHTKVSAIDLGRALGVSPDKTSFIINNWLGNDVFGITDAMYRLATGKKEVQSDYEKSKPLRINDIPIASAIAFQDQYKKDEDDFYDRRDELKKIITSSEATPEETVEAEEQLIKFEKVSAMVGEIRQAEEDGNGGRRSYEYQRYIVGLERWALGRDAVPEAPNPMFTPDAPAEVKKAIQKPYKSLTQPQYRSGEAERNRAKRRIAREAKSGQKQSDYSADKRRRFGMPPKE